MNYKFYWWSKPNNFGDILTPNILNWFDIEYEYSGTPEKANAYCIGSIARLANPNSTVIGSGIIKQTEFLDPTVDWKAVRGPLTRNKVISCGGNCPKIYGDPALLLPNFYKRNNKIEYNIGIVPHYQDYDAILSKYKDKYKDKYRVINIVNKDPLKVLDEILKCEKIISSSLHGIIAAQAYNIPVAWFCNSKLHGDGSKFHDYFLSRNITDAEYSTIENPKFLDQGHIDLDPLIEVFHNLKGNY